MEFDPVVESTKPVDAPHPLHEAYGVPRKIVADDSGSVLQVESFAQDVGRYQHVNPLAVRGWPDSIGLRREPFDDLASAGAVAPQASDFAIDLRDIRSIPESAVYVAGGISELGEY